MSFYLRNIILSLLLISNISIANNIENKKDSRITYSVSINNFYNTTYYLWKFYVDKYDTGSMLNWKVKDVLRLDNDLQIKITAKTYINLNGYRGITKGDGLLKDYDATHYPLMVYYFIPKKKFNKTKILPLMKREANSKDWNMVSYSKVKLQSLKGFDLNVQHNLFNKNNLLVDILLGFKLDDYNWDSYNMYQYDFNVFKYYINGIVIKYKELYRTPYIGLNFNYNYHNWYINLNTKYSNWAKYRGADYHVFRYIIFNMKNRNNINYYGINFKINYQIKNNINIFINYGWNKYSRFSCLKKSYKENKLTESYEESKSIYDKTSTKNINRNLGIGFKFNF